MKNNFTNEKFLLDIKEALEIEDHEVNLNDEFRDYGEWDSLNRLSLIVMLDDEYGCQIEHQSFEKLKTIQDLIDTVRASRE